MNNNLKIGDKVKVTQKSHITRGASPQWLNNGLVTKVEEDRACVQSISESTLSQWCSFPFGGVFYFKSFDIEIV